MAAFDACTKTWTGSAEPNILNPEANLGQIILNLLSRTPDKVIQINADTGYEMPCAEMKRRIIRVALNLRKLGYGPGDLATLVCTNTENVVPVYGGCLTLGMAVNPLAPVFNREELAHMMRLTQSKVVFCDETNRAVVEEAVRDSIRGNPRIYVMGKGSTSAPSVDELLVPVEGEETFEAPYLGDSTTLMAVVLCSSGTTGAPKGVCLSHAHLIEAETFADTLNAGPVFSFSQLFWMSGVFAAHMSLLCTRARVITSRPFNAETFITVVEKYKVEDTFTPPACIAEIQSHPRYQSVDFSCLKRWVLGGSPISKELLDSLVERFPGTEIKPVYGSSEVGVITSPMKPFIPGSVGTLTRSVKVKIVDENGSRLGPNEKGEIRAQFKHTFLGYINNEQMTRDACDEEGFFKTGDIGYFDSDGFLFVIDRIKDIIKYKNYQISPSDLEDVILKIDGVKQVCVAGVPTKDQSSDLPTAMIVLQGGSSLTANEVVQTVNEQVSDYKKLRGGVHFIDRLPTSPAGKVMRRVVKEMLIKCVA
ncbi:uncharacterized protein LOC134213550 isoform X2 [Armigeres subalbatus]|uniref:uncharacterized protein LOC134213550 isoform X2 n=1 Tax=Armigeres subalbatus TaxID=124917 RepID=UPI002ECFF7BC